jgi:tryptophan 2,3-dioxygenase
MKKPSLEQSAINELLGMFRFQDDPAPNGKSAEQKKISFLKNLKKNIAGIKDQYQFQNANELMFLLEGLSSEHTKGVTYWDYIEIDTLLSLQKPKTLYPDEIIFITYHQVCELYFKLIIQELERIIDFDEHDPEKTIHKVPCFKLVKNKEGYSIPVPLDETEIWEQCLNRVIRYLRNLITGWDIMKSGLSTAEFTEFRKALLPASGFQTWQFRKIEIMLTPLKNLTIPAGNDKSHIYWRKGAMHTTDKSKESKLQKNFNAKYDRLFFSLVDSFSGRTIWERFKKSGKGTQARIKPLLEKIEDSILLWKIAHWHMVIAHMPATASATGGTDYSNYLPQVKENKESKKIEFNSHNQVIYFPEFWKQRGDVSSYIQNLVSDFPSEIADGVTEIFAGSSKQSGQTK